MAPGRNRGLKMGIIARLIRDTKAVSAVEYGLIVAMIVLAMVAGLQLVAGSTIAMWNGVQSNVAANG
jgi:pilus assembly protein Flp/PilA